jgi:lysophospholipase L1-like esterase
VLSLLLVFAQSSIASGSVGLGEGRPAAKLGGSSLQHGGAAAGISALDDPDSDAITFDEFALGTTITDDYEDEGVVFTSDVFLSTDHSNPTAPVLSGTPKFFGEISGRFTVAGSDTPTTVNGFTLDVGYIDNRDSVEIQYFDLAGNTIGSTRAQSKEINRIDVFYRGVASFTVKAVEYEAAGFAIDNLAIHRQAVGIRPTRMAMLGDSYSSGEGLLDGDGIRYDCGTDLHEGLYYEGTTQPLSGLFWESESCETATASHRPPGDWRDRKWVKYENLCHRHGRAYPNAIREQLSVLAQNAIFLACAGAETRHIGADVGPAASFPASPPGVHGGQHQLQNLQDFAVAGGAPDLITVGIGGNDAGFGGIMKKCLAPLDSCTEPDFAGRTISTINGTMFRNVLSTLKKLRDEFEPATIVAFGYPSIIDDPAHWCKGFATVGEDERTWIKNEVLPTINEAIKDAADEAGVVYVDITSVTAGRGICSPEELINGARFGDDSWWGKGKESFHPNQKGHDAIATHFIDHYTDGTGQLVVRNPDPAGPIRPETGPEIRIGEIDVGAVRKCGAGCLQPAACVQACNFHVGGDGFAPNTTLTAALRSEPVLVGQVQTDPTGRVDKWIRVPRKKVKPGLHSLLLDGFAADGTRQHAVQLVRIFSRLGTPIRVRLKPVGARGRAVEMRRLVVKRMPPGTRVDIACAKGGQRVAKALAGGKVKRRGGCPFSHRAFHTGKGEKDKGKKGRGKGKNGGKGEKGGKGKRKARSQARRTAGKGKRGKRPGRRARSFARFFRKPLAPGTVVRIAVTRRGQAGRTLDVSVRGRRKPKLTRRCTEPGRRTPAPC